MFNATLNSQLSIYEKDVQTTNDKTKEIQDKLTDIEKKQNDLNAGMDKLPKDLPEELQKAVNDSVFAITTTIASDAKTIVETADKLKSSSKSLSLHMLTTNNRLERKIDRWHFWEFIPILGYFFARYCDLLYEKHDILIDISDSNEACYESIIRIKSLSSKYIK